MIKHDLGVINAFRPLVYASPSWVFIRVKSMYVVVVWYVHASFFVLWLPYYQKALPNPGEAGLGVEFEVVGEIGEQGFVELDPKDCS
jgi:hypothetical protein